MIYECLHCKLRDICTTYPNCNNNMKDFWKSWKFWVAVAAVILAIVCVVLWFVSPKFCYAASGLLIGALAGFIGGYFVGKKAIIHPKQESAPAVKESLKKENAPRKPHW